MVSSNLFLIEMIKNIDERENFLNLYLILPVGSCFISLIFIIRIYMRVNKSKEEVLSLFLEIPD